MSFEYEADNTLEEIDNFASQPASPSLSSDFGAVELLTSALETECSNAPNVPEGDAPSPNSNSEPVTSECVETTGTLVNYGIARGFDEVDNPNDDLDGLDGVNYESDGPSIPTEPFPLPGVQHESLWLGVCDTGQPQQDDLPETHCCSDVDMAFVQCANLTEQFSHLSGLNVTPNGETPLVESQKQPEHGIFPTWPPSDAQHSNIPIMKAVPYSTPTGATSKRVAKRKRNSSEETPREQFIGGNAKIPIRDCYAASEIMVKLFDEFPCVLEDIRSLPEQEGNRTPVTCLVKCPADKEQIWDRDIELFARSLPALFELLLLLAPCSLLGDQTEEEHVRHVCRLFLKKPNVDIDKYLKLRELHRSGKLPLLLMKTDRKTRSSKQLRRKKP